jgi:hypothetical protein
MCGKTGGRPCKEELSPPGSVSWHPSARVPVSSGGFMRLPEPRPRSDGPSDSNRDRPMRTKQPDPDKPVRSPTGTALKETRMSGCADSLRKGTRLQHDLRRRFLQESYLGQYPRRKKAHPKAWLSRHPLRRSRPRSLQGRSLMIGLSHTAKIRVGIREGVASVDRLPNADSPSRQSPGPVFSPGYSRVTAPSAPGSPPARG